MQESYHSNVCELLKLEAAAILRAADRLNPQQIDRAVELLAGCTGKVVFSGIGKSGIVARKIASTLTSVGTAAVFLHPSDALHGDLGIVSGEDVAVLLSNSGETDEILAMLPYMKRRTVPMIAIVGNTGSSLARQAEVVLDASVDQEACPLNLAPTASTTVALAIGDALAMTLMQVKRFSREEYALNHPAGRLGKRLTIRVADLMHRGEANPVIAPDSSWLEVITAISRFGLGAVNVTDGSGLLLGLITDGDLRRAMQTCKPAEIENLRADALMTKRPIVISEKTLAYDALKLMEDRPSQIAVLPVVDDQHRSVGLLRLHDIVRFGL
ncbi:MAG: KpsF/GutQ family sugar-phosphate isomerase [Blastocatellia bacterium]|nr:KpsF/GutQ family sugar-phosphate isomerase [Blastocatellia bacterium]